jgi:7-cyano-7-deazaguanine synthase
LPVGDLYGNHWSVTCRGVPGAEAGIDSNYLPGRNLLLLVKAAVLCAREGIRKIALAPLAENPFPDATPEFFERFAVLASSALSSPIEVAAPFRRQSKARLIREAAGFPFELTFSCIAPRGFTHCGVCTKCAERQNAFAAAGVPDPTRYRLAVGSGRLSKSTP